MKKLLKGRRKTQDGLHRRTKLVFVSVCALLTALICGAAVFVIWRSDGTQRHHANLALQRGVIARSDSEETKELSADKAIDGNDEDISSRWSSENNWEEASHYIELEFPEEISVSFVVLKWERRNAVSYALEGSLDGVGWECLERFETAPAERCQKIVLESAASVKYLRLSVYEVSKKEEDYSNLYQNVSLYEFEVYADKPAAYKLEAPSIEMREDGGRYLTIPDAPQGYEVSFIGADYEQVIGADRIVYHTIQDKTVTVGYLVTDMSGREEAQEASFTVEVPAYEGPQTENDTGLLQDAVRNECPEVIPALAEWRGGSGVFTVQPETRIIVDTAFRSRAKGNGQEDAKSQAAVVEEAYGIEDVMKAAELFAEKYYGWTRARYENTTLDTRWGKLQVCEGTLRDAAAGDIFLSYAESADGLGEEGYTCDINDICVIRAETPTGIRWGTVTLLQILSESIDTIPKGKIRDYPLYEVRGFGIDAARKAVSLDMLYAMVETMSWYKMNDFGIHLNDNVILSTSGLTDTVEQAMTAQSAFRLESEVQNDAGVKLTSEDYAYSAKEFAKLIEDAKAYGVNIVPEIDTPAHSLSITKLFPEYALSAGSESVDQLDLGNEKAKELVKDIWREALIGENAAFAKAQTVNIGMDEYYGEGSEYRKYAVEISELVQGTGRTVRLWGSLSNIDGTLAPESENLQMNLWSTLWADPKEMYDAGYSLINMQNNNLYIIPGGGYDYLNTADLYENWEANRFYDLGQLEVIPCYSSQMLGAAYMIWNDMSGKLDVGISEYDLYDRFKRPLAILAGKLWGMQGNVSYQDYQDLAEKIELGRWRTKDAVGVKEQQLLNAEIGLEPPYDITMNVYLEETSEQNAQSGLRQGQILAQSGAAYGKWAFYAAEPKTGKVGFTREGKTYTFDYVLPRGEWVEIRLVGSVGQTTLYVNQKHIATLGSTEPFEDYATFLFPTEKIGKETAHFDGEVEFAR